MTEKLVLRQDQLLSYASQHLFARIFYRDLEAIWVKSWQQQQGWLLEAGLSLAWVPFGIEGEDALRQRLSRLPGFDYDLLVKQVVDSQGPVSFCLWRRGG